ncbi:MAG: hypothetical protein ABSG23_10605 [Terriglobales bacterium]|jgi:hypothetical protein
MPGFAGLQTNLVTWLIMAGVTACWVLSVRLVPGWAREGWPSLLKSLYGIVWLDFGLDILLRFLMLSYNAVQWGNNTSRLVAQTVDTVNRTLAYCGLFWLLVALAYAFAVRRRGAGPLGLARVFTLEVAYVAAIPVALLASAAFYLTEWENRLPLALITPLELLASLYMVPAAIVWWDHFRQPGPKWRIGSIHLIVLLPALMHGYLSPYRENLAPILLIPLIAAIFAGKRPALRKVVPVGLVCLFVLSSVVGSYRRIKWENARPEEVAYEFRRASFVDWVSGAWDEPMHRFHGFDSMLLTVALVPALEPHSGRNVLVSPFLRGFVPRFVYSGKGAADAGMNFGTRIWAFDDPTSREQSGASIAPSMPGDLYDAGGVLYIALGALIWGGLLGLVDGWKAHLPVFCGAAISVLVATQCAMSVERDFDNSLATFIQTLLVFVLAAGLIALARRHNTDFAVRFDHNLERS